MSTLGLDLGFIVDAFTTGTYVLTRRTLPVNVDGIFVESDPTVETIRAAIYPEPSLADDQQHSPSGDFSDDRIMVFAQGLSAPLTTSADPSLGDRIAYQGKTYGATDSLDWVESGGFTQARFGIIRTGAL